MNESKSRSRVSKLVLTALMAALVTVFSKLQIQIPAILGVSRFHLGNVMCALCGILLGPWWGGAASGVGSAIFDLFDPTHIADFPITLITKGLYGLISGLVFSNGFRRRGGYAAQLVASACGAVSYAVLYLAKKFFLDAMLLAGMDSSAAWLVVLERLPSTGFNAAVAVVLAPILGTAILRGLRSAGLSRVLD